MELPEIIKNFPYLGLFSLLILGGIGLPFPEDGILILCGVLISTGVVKAVPAIAVIFAGLIITDFGLYFVGRKYGRMVVAHKKFRRIISPEVIRKIEEKFRRWGALFILAGRHIVVLRAQIFLVSGVVKMHPVKFIAADIAASVLTISVMVGAGYMGGRFLRVVTRDLKVVEYVAAALVLAFLVVFFLVRYFRTPRSRGARGAPPQGEAVSTSPPPGKPPSPPA